MKAGSDIVEHKWNQVPKLLSDEDNYQRYQMVVAKNDRVANRTFTIFYSYEPRIDSYITVVTSKIDFHDNRPTKTVEYRYNIIK
jgi:acetone carboxylase gamma subunit